MGHTSSLTSSSIPSRHCNILIHICFSRDKTFSTGTITAHTQHQSPPLNHSYILLQLPEPPCIFHPPTQTNESKTIQSSMALIYQQLSQLNLHQQTLRALHGLRHLLVNATNQLYQ